MNFMVYELHLNKIYWEKKGNEKNRAQPGLNLKKWDKVYDFQLLLSIQVAMKPCYLFASGANRAISLYPYPSLISEGFPAVKLLSLPGFPSWMFTEFPGKLKNQRHCQRLPAPNPSLDSCTGWYQEVSAESWTPRCSENQWHENGSY